MASFERVGLDSLNNGTSFNTYTSSELMEDYVFEVLQRRTGVARADLIEIKSEKEARELFELTYVQPMNSRLWLFKIYSRAIPNQLLERIKILSQVTETGIFWFSADRPREFFKVKEVRGDMSGGIKHMWLEYFTRDDVHSVLGEQVRYGVRTNLARYYGNDPGALFRIRKALKDEFEVNSDADLRAILGVSVGYIVYEVLRLILAEGKGQKELTKVVKRMKVFVEANGADKTRRELLKYGEQLQIFRVLQERGKLYDVLPSKLPEGSDKRSLKRFIIFRKKALEIPLGKVARFNNSLVKEYRWSNFDDMMLWLYTWVG